MPFLACIEALIRAAAAAKVYQHVQTIRGPPRGLLVLPAAAAGSWLEVFLPSETGLWDELTGTGLRLRLGERERRSKREGRLTSGSF